MRGERQGRREEVEMWDGKVEREMTSHTKQICLRANSKDLKVGLKVQHYNYFKSLKNELH